MAPLNGRGRSVVGAIIEQSGRVQVLLELFQIFAVHVVHGRYCVGHYS